MKMMCKHGSALIHGINKNDKLGWMLWMDKPVRPSLSSTTHSYYYITTEFAKVTVSVYDCRLTLNTYIHLGLEDAENELKRMEELEKARQELDRTSRKRPITQQMFRAI